MMDISIIDLFAESLKPDEARVAADVRAFAAWQVRDRDGPFEPDQQDDVDIRSWLLSQKLGGVSRVELRRCVESLQRFYAWAVARPSPRRPPVSRICSRT